MFQKFTKTFSLLGAEISLEQLLQAREDRAFLQQECIKKYGQTVLSITLTAVGGVKKNELLDYVFEKALESVTTCLEQQEIKPIAEFIRPLETGHEALFVLPMKAGELKQLMIELEESSPLARLWDLDVIDAQGNLLSRHDFNVSPRPCLVCSDNAKSCARSRKHSFEDIWAEQQKRVQAVYFAENIANLVENALLEEVYLTPKPGLVDRRNNGSHQDMNLNTFEKSAKALQPYFMQFVLKGMETASLPTSQILKEIRPLGLSAENAMFRATENVNTHKGAIFAFGLVCTAIGRLFKLNQSTQIEQIFELIAQFSQGLIAELQNFPENQPLTHGVKLYREYGFTGARGEAASGLKTIQHCLAFFSGEEEIDLHRVLLWLIAHNDDTNVVHRGGIEGLNFVKQQAHKMLQQKDIAIEALEAFDDSCIDKNISCGGSADMLALVVFFFSLLQNE